MPAGRPMRYDCSQYSKSNVVYGLGDEGGKIFYVGRAKLIGRRVAQYKSGSFHGNRRLKDAIKKCGLNVYILQEGCADLHAAEFDEIESREGLVNQITNRNSGFWSRKSTKPWVVKGAHCPTTLYKRHVRNAFGARSEFLNEHIKTLSDPERMALEHRVAEAFAHTEIGQRCNAWLEAVDVRA